MCMMVYIASDRPLPVIPWDEDRPAFHAKEVAEHEPARRQFSKPYVYYVGAHEGCGCGFQYGQDPSVEDEKDVALAKTSRRELVKYLRRALATVAMVELYACWDGDQAANPVGRSVVSPNDLLKSRTFFEEKEFLQIVAKRLLAQ